MPGYTTTQRIPKRIINTARRQMSVVTEAPATIGDAPLTIIGTLITGIESTTNLAEELNPPPSYESYYVDPFDEFDLLFGAAKLNLRIVDVPIRYRRRRYGQSNIQRWRHGWLLLRMVVFAMRRIKFV